MNLSEVSQDTQSIATETVGKCPICDSEGQYIYHQLSDFLFGKSTGWDLKQCTNRSCKLIWLDPRPTPDEIWKAYVDYYTHRKQKSSFLYNQTIAKGYLALSYGYKEGTSFLQRLLGLLAYVNPILKAEVDFKVLYVKKLDQGKLLDFGCGNGWLLENLRDLGWQVQGFDFDQKAIDYCKTNNLDVSLVNWPGIPAGSLDVITINHVIEHVHDFDDLIENCKQKLKPGGQLVIATPNTDNWLFKKYQSNWMQLDPPRHLHLFNTQNLQDVLKKHGFQIKKSKSSFRIDAWTTIVSRNVKREGYFNYMGEKKKKVDVFFGLLNQLITSFYLLFDKKIAGELIVIAEKPAK